MSLMLNYFGIQKILQHSNTEAQQNLWRNITCVRTNDKLPDLFSPRNTSLSSEHQPELSNQTLRVYTSDGVEGKVDKMTSLLTGSATMVLVFM